MIEMKRVNDMDKYELTRAIKKAKEVLNTPDNGIGIHYCIHDSEAFEEAYEEINNPPTDKEGYVQRFFLKDLTKSLIEVFLTGEEY